jgi:phosphoglycerate dehydrogenase-like enzyme
MMDLVHHHKYVALYEQQKKKEWGMKAGAAVEDRVGKRVGILGYGSIGRQGKRRSFCSFLLSVNVAVLLLISR